MEVALSGIWGQKLVIKTSIVHEINAFCCCNVYYNVMFIIWQIWGQKLEIETNVMHESNVYLWLSARPH